MRTLPPLAGVLVAAVLVAAFATVGLPAPASACEGMASGSLAPPCCADGHCGPAEATGAAGDADPGPGGCGSCALPCCAGLVFTSPSPSLPPAPPDAPPRRLSAAPARDISRLTATDLDRPPRA